MKKLRIIFFLVFTINYVSAQVKEQIVFDYFFENIFEKEYKESVCKIKFKEKTEKAISRSLFESDCLKGEEYESNKNNNSTILEPIDITDYHTKAIKKSKVKSRNKKYRLKLYQAAKINDDKYLVILLMTRKKLNTDSYQFVLDSNGQVLKWCKVEMLH
ncbi:hypothetical protein ACG2LH_16560 [Zhouia sp. PK063]|uniref:hypothetical protein n=1 Tax=Zhouia sp. PK063 TaxID=3373602 RepID=UPI003790B9B8